MSDANQIDLFYKKNGGSYGTIPAGNGKTIRLTGESLEGTTAKTKSKEIRKDRQSTDIIRTGVGVTGEISGELSYGAFDDFIEAALLSSAWAGTVTIAGTNISCSASDNSINSGSSAFVGISAGQFIRVTGFTTNGALIWARVTSATTAKLIVSGITLVNESAGASISVKASDKVQVGTTLPDFVFERAHTDVASTFADFVGCGFDSMEIGIDAQGILTIKFGVFGKQEQANTSTQMGTPTAAATNNVLNGVDHPYRTWEGGVSTANAMSAMAITLRVSNKLAGRNELGNLGPTSLRAGDVDVTGTLKAYFVSNAIKTKYLAFTTTAFAFLVRDASNNAYVFELPAVKFDSCKTLAGGVGTDCIADMTFEAFRDATVGNTLVIHRIAA